MSTPILVRFPDRPTHATDAPELAAVIDAVTCLHDAKPVAFAMIAQSIVTIGADRGVPPRTLRALRAFVTDHFGGD